MAVRKRGKSWLVTVELGRDPSVGKRRRAHLTARTRREAEAEEARLRHEVATGLDLEPAKLSLAQYMLHWLATVQPGLSETTYRRYSGLFRNQIQPSLGAILLTKLRPLHIQRLYGGLQPKLSAKSIVHVHRLLSSALNQAVRWQIIPRNVCQAVEVPRVRRREMRTLTADETRELMGAAEATDSVWGDAVILAVHTGLRQGELLGLRWEDIDLEARRVTVQRTFHYLGGRAFYQEPKTAGACRSIPLGAAAVETLHRVRRRQLEMKLLLGPAYQDQGAVLASVVGTATLPANLRRGFYQLLAAVGVGHMRFHDLRHTHASLLLARGVHPKIVSERLGHSSIKMTLDTYSHVLPNLQEQAVKDFDAWLATS